MLSVSRSGLVKFLKQLCAVRNIEGNNPSMTEISVVIAVVDVFYIASPHTCMSEI